jgi:hypothetical protein
MTFIRTRPNPEASNRARRKFYRLRVERDETGVIEIADEQVTSLSEHAKAVDGGDHETLVLTSDEVRWLHDTLGDLRRVLQEEGN